MKKKNTKKKEKEKKTEKKKEAKEAWRKMQGKGICQIHLCNVHFSHQAGAILRGI